MSQIFEVYAQGLNESKKINTLSENRYTLQVKRNIINNNKK